MGAKRAYKRAALRTDMTRARQQISEQGLDYLTP